MPKVKSFSCVKPVEDDSLMRQARIRCNRIIRKHLGANGVDIQWLAKEIGMKRTTIYARFQEDAKSDPGKRNWELQELVAICKALHINGEDAMAMLGVKK